MTIVSDNEQFFIRPDYRPNAPRSRSVSPLPSDYWTEQRIRLSYRYQWRVYQTAVDVARGIGAEVVLDIGCGPATKLNHFFDERYRLYGIDTREGVALCLDLHPRGRYFVHDLDREAPIPEGIPTPVDLVICADVIEHLEAPSHLLRLLRRVSSSQTRILISTPGREQLAGCDALTPSNPEHVREWAFDELRRYLEHSGFRVLRHDLVMPFRLGLDQMTADYLLSRFLRRLPLATTQLAVCALA